MLDELVFLLYLDQGFIKDLHSTVIEGFIESETVRYSVDSSNNNRFKLGIRDKKEKEGHFNNTDEEAHILEEQDCYTLKSIELENYTDAEFASEDKRINKKDIEHKKTFFSTNIDYSSSCVFFHPVWNKMKELRITKKIDSDYCSSGDFVEFCGEMTSISISGYILKLIDIIEAYSAETLDGILSKSNFIGDLKFEIINRMLKKLYLELQKCGTEDIIIWANNCAVVLNICVHEFEVRHLHMYDNCSCKCKIWGKVCKIIDEGDSINLLRKTGHTKYYESLLLSFEPYLECLRSNSVILPQRPSLEIYGPSILIKPISIHI
ncbi:MAG: hypothetical protein K0R15_1595 [Clostridiales bacterium]|jgi:hypothetical protein|nr:hypothetical protein [Clostridiales bacterium]